MEWCGRMVCNRRRALVFVGPLVAFCVVYSLLGRAPFFQRTSEFLSPEPRPSAAAVLRAPSPASRFPAPRLPSPASGPPSPTPRPPSPTPRPPSLTPIPPSPTPRTPSPTPRTPSTTPRPPSPTPVPPSPTPRTPSPTPRTPSTTPRPTSPTPVPPSPTPRTPSTTPRPPSPTPVPPSPTPRTPSPTPRTPSTTPRPPSPTPVPPSPTPRTHSPTPRQPSQTPRPPSPTPGPPKALAERPDPTRALPSPGPGLPSPPPPPSVPSRDGPALLLSSATASNASSSLATRQFQRLPPPLSPSEQGDARKIVCLHFTGRLGNEMFEYASILGMALTMQRVPLVLGSQHLIKVLETFPYAAGENDQNLTERCSKARAAPEDAGSKFKESLLRLEPNHDYRVGLYLQSYKYFVHQWAVVREALAFSGAIRDEADLVVRDLREKYSSSILIGVHIRRGDIANDYNVKLGYPLASQGYINRSLAYYQALFTGRRCVFVVASDGMPWCKANFPTEYHVHFLEPQRSPEVDMLTLASVDHTIITFGSYSWWIGFLNPGNTVYMKDFIINDTYVARSLNPDGRDYIYPGWIPL